MDSPNAAKQWGEVPESLAATTPTVAVLPMPSSTARGAVATSISNEQLRAFWRRLLEQKRQGRPIVSSTPYLEHLVPWQDFSISAYEEKSDAAPPVTGISTSIRSAGPTPVRIPRAR